MLCVGAILGGTLVALLVLPKLYNANTITIYGYLGDRFGDSAKNSSSVMFLVGQLFTSGSRLFIAAIAVSVILYGSIQFEFLMYSIIILGVVSTVYTMAGGIKGLIYIDTIQIMLVIGTGVVALLFIYFSMTPHMSLGDIFATLASGEVKNAAGEWVAGNKLQIVDASWRMDVPYNLMGALVGCNILVGRAMSPLMQLSSMLSRWQQSRMALKALDTLMDTPSENDREDSPVNAATLDPLLNLDDVSFSYPGSRRTSLEDISLNIRPGERVGIIGRVGSGKSTVGRLLIGLYPPDKGAVRFGGVDIRQLNTADLRGRIGYLPQDVVLFYGSIRDNIALDDPAVQERLVSRAAWLAGVTEFVRLHPAGFGAQVGERGMNLSGGQRQSIALARALLHDPDVLILDEPTSNMDTATENMVRERLQSALKDKTLVLITHRMSMLQLVKRVVIIEEGRIVADGPKEQVLRGLAAAPQASRPDSRPPEKRTEPTAGSAPLSSHPLPGDAS